MPRAAASAAPMPAKSRRRMSHLRDVAYRTCGYLSMLSFGLRALAFPCEREWGWVVRSARPPTTGGKPRACREEVTTDDVLRPARLDDRRAFPGRDARRGGVRQEGRGHTRGFSRREARYR